MGAWIGSGSCVLGFDTSVTAERGGLGRFSNALDTDCRSDGLGAAGGSRVGSKGGVRARAGSVTVSGAAVALAVDSGEYTRADWCA